MGHSSKNLLLTDIDRKKGWLCEKGTSKGIVSLQLECPTVITAVRIGNAHSAFIEVLVGNVGDATDSYQTLIPPSMFMNCYDSKSGSGPDQVKFFYQKDFCSSVSNKEWQVIQIVCTQPFNDRVPFGICFVRVTGLGDELEVVTVNNEEESKTTSSPSLEKKKKSMEQRQLPTSEEILKTGHSSTKTKIASMKTKPPRESSEGRHIKDPGKDLPDNRRNKDVGLEETSPKERVLQKEKEEYPCFHGKTHKEMRKEPEKCKTAETGKKRLKQPMCGRPFSKLMEDVVFVISGFKNPARGDIRNQALKMGAAYSTDWNTQCTHLICSYQNTPKYNEVKGKGKIVKKEWVESCFKDRKRYPWRRFALDPDEARVADSEEEILAHDDDTSDDEEVGERAGTSSQNKATKPLKKKETSDDAYVTETDDEQSTKLDTTEYPMPHLPNLLVGKTFYVDRNLDTCSQIERYIVAYNGNITEAMNEEVEFYITNSGGAVLQILRKKAPKMRAVRPTWIWEMNSNSKWLSPWKFMFS